MVLVVAGVVVLLDEAEVLLPLPLQDAVPPLCVGGEITLNKKGQNRKRKMNHRNEKLLVFETCAVHLPHGGAIIEIYCRDCNGTNERGTSVGGLNVALCSQPEFAGITFAQGHGGGETEDPSLSLRRGADPDDSL